MDLKSWNEVKELDKEYITEKLSRYMNDLDGNLFKYSHKGINLNEYNKIKKLLKGSDIFELEGADEEGTIEAIKLNKEHILTYDEYEGIIYSNYKMKDLFKGNLNK